MAIAGAGRFFRRESRTPDPLCSAVSSPWHVSEKVRARSKGGLRASPPHGNQPASLEIMSLPKLSGRTTTRIASLALWINSRCSALPVQISRTRAAKQPFPQPSLGRRLFQNLNRTNGARGHSEPQKRPIRALLPLPPPQSRPAALECLPFRQNCSLLSPLQPT